MIGTTMLRIPLRWRLAGALHRLPEFRGRDRLTSALIGTSLPPDGIHGGSFGPALRYEVRYRDDGSYVDLFFLQYQEPALAPVLRATLRPGGTFFDVGANIGIYAAWGARLVSDTGTVHAFEPVPATRQALERLVAFNGLTNVRVIPCAIGSREGALTLHVAPGASGLTTTHRPEQWTEGVSLTVAVTTLDAHVRTSGRSPDLVLVDVEGYEFEVLRGSREVLSSDRPPVVLFESHSGHLARCGTNLGSIVGWLEEEVGYEVFGLTPAGLVRTRSDTSIPPSGNCLALRAGAHQDVRRRLERYKFRRNQSC